jgi:hypothetical protein
MLPDCPQQQQFLSRWNEAMQHPRRSQQLRRSSSKCVVTPLQSSRAARSSAEVCSSANAVLSVNVLMPRMHLVIYVCVPSIYVSNVAASGCLLFDAQLVIALKSTP